MFANILKNRLFIGALAFFVLCVVGSLLYMQHVKQQTVRTLAEGEKRVQQWNEKQNEAPTAKAPVGHTSQGGHRHADSTWHEGSHDSKQGAKGPRPTPPSQRPLEASGEKIITKEEEAEWHKYWAARGLEPPPAGYNYQWDEHGNASLYQYNVPEFEVKWSEEEYPGQDYSKLSQEEWKRHRALRHIVRQTPLRLTQEHEKILRAGGPFPKVTYPPGVVELAKEKIRELDQKASGRTPRVSTTITWNRPPTDKEREAIVRRENELLKSLESQKPKPPPLTGWSDETYVDALVRELEAEAQRR